MLRRSPEAVVVAYIMDPQRRELYVEGVGDKSFLDWLIGEAFLPGARVVSIDSIDIEVDEGGNRGRLLAFLKLMVAQVSRIRGLVDADDCRLLEWPNTEVPSNAWLTDHRDIEGYFLTVDNLDKTLRLGCGVIDPSALAVYEAMNKAGRIIAAFRLVSIRRSLRLPVSKGAWIRHVDFANATAITVNSVKIATVLLQAADRSLRELQELVEAVQVVEAELESLPDRDVVHGKDAMRILTKQLACIGVSVDDAARMMRVAFDKGDVAKHPSLQMACAFCSGP